MRSWAIPWFVQRFLTLLEPTAKRCFTELLQAIAYIHTKGVCHRDLKPENILLDQRDKRVKVADFSVSKYFLLIHGEEAKRAGMCTHTGTMAYNAPEALAQVSYTYVQISGLERA